MPIDVRARESYDLRVFVGCDVIHKAYASCPQGEEDTPNNKRLCARYEHLGGWEPYLDAYMERRAQ